MPFTAKSWVDGVFPNGLLNAAAMIDMENRLSAYSDSVVPSLAIPTDLGLLGMSHDTAPSSTGTVLPTAGLVNVTRIYLRASVSITNVCLIVGTAGVTLTAGQNFAALFQGTTLLGVTADQATNWQSTGYKVMALTGGPFVASVGSVVVAWYANGSTLPGFIRGASTSSYVLNFGLNAANSRYGTADAGRTTTMPSPLGTITATGTSYWAGVS